MSRPAAAAPLKEPDLKAVRPRLQLALDMTSLPAALAPLQRAAEYIDIIEVGTILCLSEGLHAVRAVRALFPERPILADVRVAEAGSIIAKIAFDAGASWISVVAGASLTTVEQVCRIAQQYGGEVQVELSDTFDPALASRWRDAGVAHAIVHRSRDAEAAGRLTWAQADLDRIDELHAMGFTVTITGGVTAADLTSFAGRNVGIVIAGRAITAADDPAMAALALREAIARVWS